MRQETGTAAFWRQAFSEILADVFSTYDITDITYAESVRCNPSTVRRWFTGSRLPRRDSIQDLFPFLLNRIRNTQSENKARHTVDSIEYILGEQHLGTLHRLHERHPDLASYVIEVLRLCIINGRQNNSLKVSNALRTLPSPVCTGKTLAVVFDFDGTLTTNVTNRTSWERIWIGLGYKIEDCQSLHRQFDKGAISHTEWCKLTEEAFIRRHLHREFVENVADQISLLPGVIETFETLQKRDIKIYIVSGSILHIIKRVMGGAYLFVDGIKANQFFFAENGLLIRINGTKYDFEGKAHFLSELATELHIAPKDILFVGNSLNDRFAYESGVRTLCINPRNTDVDNRTIWHHCINNCHNLKEILRFI